MPLHFRWHRLNPSVRPHQQHLFRPSNRSDHQRLLPQYFPMVHSLQRYQLPQCFLSARMHLRCRLHRLHRSDLFHRHFPWHRLIPLARQCQQNRLHQLIL